MVRCSRRISALRSGDWFGSAVNLASRITDLAKSGEYPLVSAPDRVRMAATHPACTGFAMSAQLRVGRDQPFGVASCRVRSV
jgi:class 3 adenylate cyclase